MVVRMRMPQEDKQKIRKYGCFLEEKGYQADSNDYGVSYSNGQIKIKAYYERYDNGGGVDIKFPGNYHFSIGWIAVVRENADFSQMEILDKILFLLKYLEQNFDKITTYDYCDESYLLLDDYFERRRKENPQLFPVRGISYAESKANRKRFEDERKRSIEK